MARMEVQSVRFGPDQWEIVRRAAELTPTGTAQFIRESSFARAVAVIVIHQLYGGEERTELAELKTRLTGAMAMHPALCGQVLDALNWPQAPLGTKPEGE